jgi:hypothetical protein
LWKVTGNERSVVVYWKDPESRVGSKVYVRREGGSDEGINKRGWMKSAM